MKENNFILIPAFMRTKLNLKGNELIIASLIHQYSKAYDEWFAEDTKYIARWTGLAEKNVLRNLKKLTEKGVIIKQDVPVNNIAKRCLYKFTYKSLTL